MTTMTTTTAIDFPNNVTADDIIINNSKRYIVHHSIYTKMNRPEKLALDTYRMLNGKYRLYDNRRHLILFEGMKLYMTMSNMKELYNSFEAICNYFTNNQLCKICVFGIHDDLYEESEYIDRKEIGATYLYMFRIEDNIYKYGQTARLGKRFENHKRKLGCEKLVFLKKVPDINLAMKIEKEFKYIIESHGKKCLYHGENGTIHQEMCMLDESLFQSYLNIFRKMVIDIVPAYIENKMIEYASFVDKAVMLPSSPTEIRQVSYMEDQGTTLKAPVKNNIDYEGKMAVMQNDLQNLHDIITTAIHSNTIKPDITVSNLIVKKLKRGTENCCLIPENILVEFVEKNIVPKEGGRECRSTIYARLIKSESMKHYAELKSNAKSDLYDRLAAIIRIKYNIEDTLHKHIIRNKGDPKDKDYFYEIAINDMSIREFINECCNRDEYMHESKNDINKAYRQYCIDKIYSEITQEERVKIFEENFGRPEHIGTRDYYNGVYLKNNNMKKFIESECIPGDVKIGFRARISDFTKSYGSYCEVSGYQEYKNIERIILILGYNIDNLDGGRKDVIGLKLKNIPYPRAMDENFMPIFKLKKKKENVEFNYDDFIKKYIQVKENSSITRKKLLEQINVYRPMLPDQITVVANNIRNIICTNFDLKLIGTTITGACLHPVDVVNFVINHCIINENLSVPMEMLDEEYNKVIGRENRFLVKNLKSLGYRNNGIKKNKGGVITGIFPKNNIIEKFLAEKTLPGEFILLYELLSLFEEYVGDGKKMSRLVIEYLTHHKKLNIHTAKIYGIKLNLQ